MRPARGPGTWAGGRTVRALTAVCGESPSRAGPEAGTSPGKWSRPALAENSVNYLANLSWKGSY